jgi:hypothetical protein
MDESFGSLAVVELPGGPVGVNAGQRGHVEHPPKSAIVAFWPVQVPAHAARIPWHRDQSGVGRQSAGGGEGCQVPAGRHQEFRAEVGSEAGQRLDGPRVRVITETLGDGLVVLNAHHGHGCLSCRRESGGIRWGSASKRAAFCRR